MSTYAPTYERGYDQQPNSNGPKLIGVAFIFAIFMIVVMAIGLAAPTPAPAEAAQEQVATWTLVAADGVYQVAVEYGQHAVERHGMSEVALIRACFEQPDLQKYFFRDKMDKNKFTALCQLDPENDVWGLIILRKGQQVYREVTAFMRDNPTLNSTMRYILQNATKWNRPLPPL